MKFPHLLLATALTIAAGQLHAGNISIAPAADTYLEAYDSETKNFGSAPTLRADEWGGRKVLLRFPVDKIDAGKWIERATLRLFIKDVGFNEAGEFPELKTCISLADLVTPWTESGATHATADGAQPWKQGPGLSGTKYEDVGPLRPRDTGVYLPPRVIPLDAASARAGEWLELDVTDFIRERRRAGDREVSLLLRSSTLGRNYAFASREAPAATEHPQLAVEVSEKHGDFALDEVVIADWEPGREVAVARTSALQPGTTASSFAWSFKQKPAASKMTDAQLRSTASGVQFTPDVAGHYELTCRFGGAGIGEHSSSPTVRVLAVKAASHPRIYVTPETLPRLRQNMQSGARISKAYQDWVANGTRGIAEGKYHDMGAKDGCEDNALMYLLTGDKAYAEHASAYATHVLAKPMPEHFENVHSATFVGAAWVHAIAVYYDWCYDQLSPEQRKSASHWLKQAAAWSWERSPAPIAHNDGGARQLILASAAYALLGDDPEAGKYLLLSNENFERNLLPWLNDGGSGGRSGDGGSYEGLHGFFIVRYAWMAHTASGADLFSESPFFANRVKHLLFGWYPRPLVEKNNSFSMRAYYSPSGDHIRNGYVGDTQPYQSAAALVARYRDTPEGKALRKLGGEWPTRWMQYTLRWAVLSDWETAPTADFQELSYLDKGTNTLYSRSDWSDDATWVLFENSPLVSAHGALDSGTFEIFKGDLLAARTGNCDDGSVGAKHSLQYLHRTIAANSLLVDDPLEKWKGFLSGAEGIHDGGGQRTNWPLTTSPDEETYRPYRHVFQRGQITRSRQTQDFAYALADLAPAYTSAHFHSGKLNTAKVASYTRQLTHLRGIDAVLVFDRVSSTKPEYRKSWLLHSLGDLDVLDGKETKVDEGESRYTGATRAVIRYGWPKPQPSFGRCLSVTLLPENAVTTKIGGRVDLPEGQLEGFPGDESHCKHRHRHVKDFWVRGVNLPPGNPPEARWFGDPALAGFVPGTPDESGGRGKWRIEVSPPTPATDDVFFHVLLPKLGTGEDFAAVQRLDAGAHAGALLQEGNRNVAVFFARTEKQESVLSLKLPSGVRAKVIAADLRPGTYQVKSDGSAAKDLAVGEDGLLVLEDASGEVNVTTK
jgi:heparin/heparan-sulfate lyase